MKIAGLIGSLQMVNIICSILRSKLVAIWMGPAAIGIFGLLNSALDMISMLAQLGLKPSAVRRLGMAHNRQIPALVRAIRRTAFVLGTLGAIATLACSHLLAAVTFGDTSWWWAFAWLALAVLLNAINNSESAIFQGLKRFRKLARCSMIGTLGGCLVSIPMFYFWRMQSIVPSILAYAICTWIALGLYREKVPSPGPHDNTPSQNTIATARSLLSFGAYLTVMGFINYAVSYIFMTFLNHTAAETTVGYYNAASTLVNRYAALVLTALSMEYLPRLSAHAHSPRRTSIIVSNQLILVLMALTAVIPAFIALSPVILRLFYSSEFLPAMPFIVFAAAATLLKGASWCMATEIMARGDGRTFFLTEIISGIISLILSVAGFTIAGFTGLGIAYLLWYTAYIAIIAWVYRTRYNLTIHPPVFRMAITAALVTTPTLIIALTGHPLWGLIIAIPASAWAANRLRLKFIGR